MVVRKAGLGRVQSSRGEERVAWVQVRGLARGKQRRIRRRGEEDSCSRWSGVELRDGKQGWRWQRWNWRQKQRGFQGSLYH